VVASGTALDGRAARVYLKLNNNVDDAPAINGGQIQALLGLEPPDRAAVEAQWRARRRRRRPEGPRPAC
jgi:hypothetical protein